jgi:23S rRNA (adenine2503-C2)-methyltransferase
MPNADTLNTLPALRERLRALGANPAHAGHVLRAWVQARPSLNTQRRRAEDHLPQRLREGLPALMAELQGLVRLHSEHAGADGSARMLIALADGQSVEAVRLPRAEGLCVSTQVGCAVGCVFCTTGLSGLLRQMGSTEIVAQVALARQARPVHKVVFMGMGEPAHNLDAVLDAIDCLGTEGGIGHKNLVLSSVGDARLFDALDTRAATPGAVKPALALSLHSTDDAQRRALLPRAPRLSVLELLERTETYARASGYPLQLQWALLEGINDSEAEIEGLLRLLPGRHAVLNLIPYNAAPGLPYQRPAAERSAEMARRLHRGGVLTKLRQSAGQDVDAGCGQLRSRSLGLAAAQTVRVVRSAAV